MIERVPGQPGIWTCLVPGGQVMTINTRAKTGFSTVQIHGVFYTALGALTPMQKAAAEHASTGRIAAGGPVDLGPYRKKAPFLQKLQRVLQVIAFGPAILVGTVAWASGAWWRVAGLMAASYVVYEVGERTGFITWAKTLFRMCGTLAWSTSSLLGTFWEYYVFVEERLEDFNHNWNTEFTMKELMMAAFAVLTVVCLISYYWDEIKETVVEKQDEEIPESPTCGSPVTSDDEYAEQVQAEMEGNPNGPYLRKLTDLVTDLSRSQETIQRQMYDAQRDARQEKMMREVMQGRTMPAPVSIDAILRRVGEVEEKVHMD